MFKENFKAANDSIHADEKLIEQVLRQKSVKKRRNLAKYYSVAAAAVVVVSVTAFTLPKMLDRDNSGVIEEHTVTQSTGDSGLFGRHGGTESGKPHTPEASTPVPKTSAVPKTSSPQTPKASTAPKAKPTPKASTAPKAKSTPKTSTAPKTTAAPAAKATTAPQAVTSTPKPAENNAVSGLPSYSFENDSVSEPIIFESDSAQAQETVAKQKQENTKTAALKINVPKAVKAAPVMSERTDDTEYSVSSSAAGGGGAASGGASASKYAADIAEEYHSIEWDNKQYAEYLGYDLMKKIVLPEDFTYSGDEKNVFTANEDGSLSYDGKIYAYTGNDLRSVTAVTTKDTANVSGYIDGTEYETSDICGVKTVIIQEEKGYECYMINNGISISVFTYGISEDELREILVSLT